MTVEFDEKDAIQEYLECAKKAFIKKNPGNFEKK